ncbi:MAG TPA: EamA family transporter, partial [Microlunatus sp.]|nr:EamA family transporter [Microlunatus sp.]
LLTLRGIDVSSGAVLILMAAGLFAVHLCALSRWVGADRIASSTLVQLVTAALLVLAIGVLSDGTVRLPRSQELGSVLYLGAVATAAAFLAVTWAQTRIDATTTAVVLTLEPVVGAAAAVVLGEPLSVAAAVGAVAVLGATGLATSGARRGLIPVVDGGMTQDGAGVAGSVTRGGPAPRRAA